VLLHFAQINTYYCCHNDMEGVVCKSLKVLFKVAMVGRWLLVIVDALVSCSHLGFNILTHAPFGDVDIVNNEKHCDWMDALVTATG
jgi:hypothetical protein